MASIIDTDQQLVAQAFVKRLQDQLGLDNRACYETTEALGAIGKPLSGDFWVRVQFEEGSFLDGQFQAGGGEGQCREFGEALVVAFSRIRTDSTDRDTNLLHHERRGLLAIKKRLLTALVGQQLFDDQGNALLANLIYAKRSIAPKYDPEKATGWIGVSFGLDFDWDLSGSASG